MKVWLILFIMLQAINVRSNINLGKDNLPGQISGIRIWIDPGTYCFWELYSMWVSDFLFFEGNCPISRAEILDGQGTSEIQVLWKIPGTYYYKATVIDQSGCINVKIGRIDVKSLTEGQFFIPEAFSPDNDGIHDEFRIIGLEAYPDACLKIYNRKGQLIFYKEKYGNLSYWGQPRDAWWRGDIGGASLVPQGNYLYVLVLNHEFTIRGTVMVAYVATLR